MTTSLGILMMTKSIAEAVELLRDENLVWGSDFDGIRYALADLLLVSAAQGDVVQAVADTLAKRLTVPYGATYDPQLEVR